jgi:hypothetical protein
MNEPTHFAARSDGQGVEADGEARPVVLEHSRAPEKMASDKVRCEACPVLCQISPGKLGACDRYGNVDGKLTRLDTLHLVAKPGVDLVEWQAARGDGWDGSLLDPAHTDAPVFVSGIGSGTTYPDYKPAPFIVASKHQGVDLVTVVTEGIFSYCSFKVKIDTDRYLGPEQATVRHRGEAVGHVSTIEYGSQFLALGGVHHLTGGSKKEGRIACELMMALGNKQPVELEIEGGARVVVAADKAPIVDGVEERRMRVGCGSATIIRVRGRKSTPGRYFQVASPGSGWGGTDITDPLSIVESWDAKHGARPGLRLLMVSTTGEDSAWFVLDDALVPRPAEMPPPVRRVVERIGENCEPSLCSVLYVAGAGGSLRAGVTENPVALTRSIKSLLVNVTCGGAPVYVWPGGGITVMVDVARMPANSFGSVPTPAIVSPIEFTMRLDDYRALGGHVGRVRRLEDVIAGGGWRVIGAESGVPWPLRAAVGGER